MDPVTVWAAPQKVTRIQLQSLYDESGGFVPRVRFPRSDAAKAARAEEADHPGDDGGGRSAGSSGSRKPGGLVARRQTVPLPPGPRTRGLRSRHEAVEGSDRHVGLGCSGGAAGIRGIAAVRLGEPAGAGNTGAMVGYPGALF